MPQHVADARAAEACASALCGGRPGGRLCFPFPKQCAVLRSFAPERCATACGTYIRTGYRSLSTLCVVVCTGLVRCILYGARCTVLDSLPKVTIPCPPTACLHCQTCRPHPLALARFCRPTSCTSPLSCPSPLSIFILTHHHSVARLPCVVRLAIIFETRRGKPHCSRSTESLAARHPTLFSPLLSDVPRTALVSCRASPKGRITRLRSRLFPTFPATLLSLPFIPPQPDYLQHGLASRDIDIRGIWTIPAIPAIDFFSLPFSPSHCFP